MPIDLDIKFDPVVRLNARRTVDGNIMIFDHEDVDIILLMKEKKCLTFPKEEMSDRTYSSQDRMFKFLAKRGVIDVSSVRGGNIYGSMEAQILESELPGVDPIQATIYVIHEYVKSEEPYFDRTEKLDMDKLDYLLRPSEKDSTEFGEIPHSAKKGSNDPRVRPYGYQYNYSLLREEEEKE